MKSLTIKQSRDIDVSTDICWDIIGPNFTKIADWGSGVYKSWENESAEKKFEKAPVGGRYCDVKGFGKFDERIIKYDPENFTISWSATGEKLPSFISNLHNNIVITKKNDNACTVTSTISADMKGFMGIIMGSFIHKKFTKQINGFLNDWKAYAETGKASENKQAEIDKK